jgi:hypothetical protein
MDELEGLAEGFNGNAFFRPMTTASFVIFHVADSKLVHFQTYPIDLTGTANCYAESSYHRIR